MRTRHVLIGAILAAAWAVPTGVAIAGKPGGVGGGTGGGTMYYAVNAGGIQSVWSMGSDGSGQTQLPVSAGYGRLHGPSHQLHSGKLWFIVRQDVGGTDPNGPHAELFAVRDDGLASVQLTADPNFAAISSSWAKDDSFLSLSGVDFSVPGAPVSRLLRVGLQFDGAGSPATVGAPASVVALPGVVGGGGYGTSLIGPHDWAPTGDQVVWLDVSNENGNDLSACVLWVTTVAGGATTTLATGGASPQWSNNGAAIVFQSVNGIDTISPGGAGRTTIVKLSRAAPSVAYQRPNWSPTGSHIAYQRIDHTLFGPSDVWRATSTGQSRSALTADVMAVPLGWR